MPSYVPSREGCTLSLQLQCRRSPQSMPCAHGTARVRSRTQRKHVVQPKFGTPKCHTPARVQKEYTYAPARAPAIDCSTAVHAPFTPSTPFNRVPRPPRTRPSQLLLLPLAVHNLSRAAAVRRYLPYLGVLSHEGGHVVALFEHGRRHAVLAAHHDALAVAAQLAGADLDGWVRMGAVQDLVSEEYGSETWWRQGPPRPAWADGEGWERVEEGAAGSRSCQQFQVPPCGAGMSTGPGVRCGKSPTGWPAGGRQSQLPACVLLTSAAAQLLLASRRAGRSPQLLHGIAGPQAPTHIEDLFP